MLFIDAFLFTTSKNPSQQVGYNNGRRRHNGVEEVHIKKSMSSFT